MRLNRLIARASNLSRRAADGAIERGEVAVNGTTVTRVGTVVDPHRDRVSLKGHTLKIPEWHQYLAFHKPRGFLVTKSDPAGRPTIWDILKELRECTNAVGRLDFDSEGLLLITSDGDMMHRLTHPRHGIRKSYHVKVRGEPDSGQIRTLNSGVELTDGITAPACVHIHRRGAGWCWLAMEIGEGRNRQIRRMCEAVGLPVVRLVRVGIGPVRLRSLKAGHWRALTDVEIARLKEACST